MRCLPDGPRQNFFKYMREHYNLDGLADYCIEAVPETTRVVNPAYRTQVRSKAGLLSRKLAEFGALNLEGEIEP
ncbi:MAG: putative transposase, partial [Gammaproteobacteria bacterium]